jgi:hypothetical protein
MSYEYKEFVYPISPSDTWCKLGAGGYTEAGARVEFWNDYQRGIMGELQKEFDNRWEPISEIGPGGITIKTKREFGNSPVERAFKLAFIIVGGFISVGIGWFVLPFVIMDWIARPTGFRANLRRMS